MSLVRIENFIFFFNDQSIWHCALIFYCVILFVSDRLVHLRTLLTVLRLILRLRREELTANIALRGRWELALIARTLLLEDKLRSVHNLTLSLALILWSCFLALKLRANRLHHTCKVHGLLAIVNDGALAHILVQVNLFNEWVSCGALLLLILVLLRRSPIFACGRKIKLEFWDFRLYGRCF